MIPGLFSSVMNIGILLALQSIAFVTVRSQLQLIYEWKSLNYAWNGPEHRDIAIRSGLYDPNVFGIPNDVDAVAGKIFLTVMRDSVGVPASLFTVSEENSENGMLLRPYPNWEFHSRDKCKGITNVHSIAIDRYKRLFALDTGKIGDRKVCNPQILVFNATDDSLINRFLVPHDVATNKEGKGLLANLVVEESPMHLHCYYVYIADTQGFGLIVFNGEKRKFTRLESDYFACDPAASSFEEEGRKFRICDGIRSMALATHQDSKERLLYFRSVASYNLNYVRVSDLHEAKNGEKIAYHSYSYKLEDRSRAMAVARYDESDVLFFGSIEKASVRCWNTSKEFNEKNLKIATKDSQQLQFVSGMKVVSMMRGFQHLLVLSNRYQSIGFKELDPIGINFYALTTSIPGLVRELLKD